jgi:hypothetical protein
VAITKEGYERNYVKREKGKQIRRYAHVMLAERVLGKKLPIAAVVHHADGNGTNNKTGNLIICENAKYHNLLHMRTRALRASGHANWRKCSFCKQYDDPVNMYTYKTVSQAYHRECRNLYDNGRD